MAEKTTAFTGPVVVGLNDKKGEIRLTDGKNVNEAKYLSIAAPDNITSDTTLIFPNGAGTNGQVLTTDGNGDLTWSNAAGNPDGTSGQVQFNDNGAFGAIPDGTSGQVLKSNGAGVAPSFQTDATNSPGGSNTEMQFNDNGTFGAVSNGTSGQVLKSNGAGVAPSFQTDATNSPGGSNTEMQFNDNGTFGAVSNGTAGQILTSNGAGSTPTFQAAASSGIAAVVDDTTPQLGGNLDLNGNDITGTGDINYTGALNASGSTIKLDGPFPVGTSNTVLGPGAGSNATGSFRNSVAIGTDALRSGNIQGNTAVGYRAMRGTTTGSNNVAVGSGSLEINSTGANNVAIGGSALFINTGGNNTAVGGNSCLGNGSNLTNCTAVGNTAGSGAGVGGVAASNLTCIGYNAEPSAAGASDEVTLGDANVATLRCQVTSITSLSDARDKKDVEDANIGLDFINDLRPVKFVWDTRDGAKKDIKEVGFIAQELDEVQQKHGVEDHLQLVLKNNPDKLEASQGKLIPILVQAIKDLKKEIDELKKA